MLLKIGRKPLRIALLLALLTAAFGASAQQSASPAQAIASPATDCRDCSAADTAQRAKATERTRAQRNAVRANRSASPDAPSSFDVPLGDIVDFASTRRDPLHDERIGSPPPERGDDRPCGLGIPWEMQCRP